jgi:hypothetical protein
VTRAPVGDHAGPRGAPLGPDHAARGADALGPGREIARPAHRRRRRAPALRGAGAVAPAARAARRGNSADVATRLPGADDRQRDAHLRLRVARESLPEVATTGRGVARPAQRRGAEVAGARGAGRRVRALAVAAGLAVLRRSARRTGGRDRETHARVGVARQARTARRELRAGVARLRGVRADAARGAGNDGAELRRTLRGQRAGSPARVEPPGATQSGGAFVP